MFSSKMHKIALLLCIVFAVVSAVLFIYQAYTFISRDPAPPSPQPQAQTSPPRDELFRGVSRDSPIVLLYSLFGFVASSLAAAQLYDKQTLPATEHPVQKLQVVHVQPDGKALARLLEQNGGSLAQSELVKKSGMDKLRVSRAIKRLEQQQVITKHPYGMTNRINLAGGKQIV